MGLVRDTSRRRGLAYVLALMLLFGTILTFSGPAIANHPDGSCLDVAPETDTNPTGTTHSVTATLRAGDDSVPLTPFCPGGSSDAAADEETVTATAPVLINFEIFGANDPNDDGDAGPPDRTCTIQAGQSSCGMPGYVGTSPGEDTIRGWVAAHDPDTDEPQDSTDEERADPFGDEPDTTDVVTKTWTGGAVATVNCEPEQDTNPAGDAHTVTCTATNETGGFVEGEDIHAEATGANDPDGGNTPTSPDFTCETDVEGQCSFTHGPGGDAQTGKTGCPAPCNTTNDQGTTTYRAWADTNDNAGSFEGDPNETRAENDNDNTDVVEKDWEAHPLNCTPEDDLNPTGEDHTVTCTFFNEQGQPQSGQRIHAEATGANDPDNGETPTSPDFACTTDAQGQCSFTHGPGGNARTGQGTACPAPCNRTNNQGTTIYRAWVDSDNDAGTFNGDASEGVDEETQPGAVPEGDRTDVVQKRWGASRLDCTPETDRNPAGTSHTVTCATLTDGQANVAGVEVDVEATGANDPDGSASFNNPDFTCITQSTGRCSIIHGPGGVGTTTNGGTTTYTAWIDFDNSNTTVEADPDEGRVEQVDPTEPDDTDVVDKTWIASRLDCNPETDTNPAQSAHTVTCSATDASGAPQAGMNIDVEATGANDPDAGQSFTSPDFSCTTGTDGTCSFIHGPGGRGTTEGFGRTLYRAWIDADGNDATVEADPSEGRDEGPAGSPSPTPTPTPTATSTAAASGARTTTTSGHVVAQQTGSPTPTPTNSTASPSPSPSDTAGASPSPSPSPTGTPAPSGPGTRSEPDDTDVVEKNWSAVPAALAIEPETDSAPVGSCNIFTITATDASGNPVQNVVVDVEQRHERSDNTTPNDEPNVSFCTPGETEGSNPSAVDPTRGDLGGGEDGTIGGEALNGTDAEGKVSIGIRVSPGQGSNGTGNVLVTAFYENEDNDDPDSGDPQDSATKTWVPSQARTIDCDPEDATNRVGTEHTVTCTVRDVNGDPVQGEGVTFTEDGPGDFTSATQSNTDAGGNARATVTSSEAGTQTITGALTSSTEGEPDTDECDRPAGDPQGAPAGNCSDTVEKTWNPGRRVASGPCRNFFQGTRTDRRGGGQVIVGTNGPDTLRGTSGRDLICGLGGRDTLIGRGAADRLVGGGGNDTLRGRGGNDRLFGNGGNDTLQGNGGDDILKGGPGRDSLQGGGGKDSLFGNGGRDRLSGGAARDQLDGGGGIDRCRGGAGNDRLRNCE